ncbi:hypothetical protein FH972_013467 [Carpinus fangiana]|uniref:Uncharacterized protein n=1 Tax=Carpinus fangiana TaxID=176857 RepID=A0A5N6R6V6_9ROSI|nr:hypothetical protein FH972_013467 [Carpinus fangiana]
MKAWKWKGGIISGDSQEINGVCKCHLSCNNAEMSRPSPGGRRATMISRSAVCHRMLQNGGCWDEEWKTRVLHPPPDITSTKNASIAASSSNN